MAKKSNAVRKVTESNEANEEVHIEAPQVEASSATIDGIPVDAKGRKTTVQMSMEELETRGLKSKSAVMRYLSSEGYSPSAIAKFLDVRYQFVRNVLNQPLKRPTATMAEAENATPKSSESMESEAAE